MVDVRQATEELLRSKPELREPILKVIDVDRKQEDWGFDDLPLDSGEFGEIVSAGIVERTGDRYRLVDPDAVDAAVHGRTHRNRREQLSAGWGRRLSTIATTWNATTVAGVVGALAFLFLLRVPHYRAVFREEHVVSPANDPYFYRYINDELLAISTDPWSLEVIANLPARAATRRPLAHVANWWVAAVLGGDQWAADMTAAWLPVVATLALGVVICWMATVLTGDLRVGAASVFVFALSPIHAVYGGLGFLEHRLHQYFWMGVTVLALTWLAVDLVRRRQRDARPIRTHLRSTWTWVAAGGITVGLAASILAWGGSIIMCFPLAAYIGIRAAMDARAGVPPVAANLPLLAGLGGGVGVTAWFHLRWGWHEPFVVYVPALLLVGAIGVFLTGEGVRRQALPVPAFLAIQLLAVMVGVYALRLGAPDVWTRLVQRADDLLYRESAVETTSMFAGEWGGLLAPLLQYGLDFLIGLVVLVWAWIVLWRAYEPAVAVFCSYVSVWLVLGAIQIRFAAQLWIVISVLGGFGVVWLLSWMDLARSVSLSRRPHPNDPVDPGEAGGPPMKLPQDLRMGATLAFVLLFVSSLSLIFVPTAVAETTYDDDQYAALQAMERHADSVDELGHERFVLSNWGHNRMYNYFMHGDANSYGYARSNYFGFIAEEDPDERFDQFDGRVGYLVIDAIDGPVPDESVQAQLGRNVSPDDGSVPDVAHYRAIYIGETATAYAVVPGATIQYNETEATNVSVIGEVRVAGSTYSYDRTAVAGNESGAITVAYPGQYEIEGTQVTVTQEDVITGGHIEVAADETG